MEKLIEKLCFFFKKQHIDTIIKILLGMSKNFVATMRRVLNGNTLKMSPSNIVLYDIEIKISQLPQNIQKIVLKIAELECSKKKCESCVTYNDRKNVQIILTKYQYLIMMLFSKEFVAASALKVKVAMMMKQNKEKEVRPMILKIVDAAKKKKGYKMELKETCEMLLRYF